MEQFDFCLTVLGARGSIPVSHKNVREFGGSTSCYMVRAGDETIFLDAGTGLIFAPDIPGKAPTILLSHLHLDHVLGLGMYPRLSQPGKLTHLMLKADSAEQAKEQLAALYSPPFWPLPLTDYAGDLDVVPLTPSFQIGEVHVEVDEGRHPGDCAVFRLWYKNKSLVYASDFEPDDASFSRLASFSRDTDLLLYDAQYTEDAYPLRKGFGHSTAEMGIELMEQCGAARLLLIHHDPLAFDDVLSARDHMLGRKNVSYARESEMILL